MKTFINTHPALQKALAFIAIAALVFSAVPALPAIAAEGEVNTVTGSCGAPVNANQYEEGQAVLLKGKNYDPNTEYDWDITEVGGANPTVLASGQVTTDGNGEFCFTAIPALAEGTSLESPYKATAGGKSDNFSVVLGATNNGTITVVKELVNEPEGVTPDDFSFTVNGGTAVNFDVDGSTDSPQNLNDGPFTVVEVEADGEGYTTSYEGCSAIELTSEGATCTITNTYEIVPPPEMPTVTVTKQTIPDGNQTGFQFYMDDEPASFATLSDGDSSTAQVVATGTEIYVFEGLIENWELTSVTCLDDDQQDVIASTTVDGVIIQALSEGDDVTCVFTNTDTTVPTFDVSGTKFDWNSEQGLEGWVIEIYNDGAEVPFATTSTDGDGNYTFSGIANGPYVICEVMQDGWEQMLPDTQNGCYSVEVDDENVIDRDFWNREIPTFLIDGYKFEDENGNGIWDMETEDGLMGWVIELYEGEDLVATTTTDEFGYYSFDVEAGNYTVAEVQQEGWQQTAPEVGTCGVTVGELVLFAIADDVAQEETSCNFGNQRIPEALSCSLIVNDSSVEDGTTVTLTWNTTSATDVSIDNGIGPVALDGSTDVVIENDITYTLTASNAQTEQSVNCPVFINEESGGGGGGGGGKKIELREDPEPEVLGESDAQTEILPAGAPNAGMGGAAATSVPAVVAFFSLIASALVARRVN